MNLSPSLGAFIPTDIDEDAAAILADMAALIAKTASPSNRPRDRSRMEEGMRFAVWAMGLRGGFPSLEQVCEHFNVSRPTAYRYRHQWAATLGITPPCHVPPERRP